MFSQSGVKKDQTTRRRNNNTYVLGLKVQFGIEDPGQEKNKCLRIILVSPGRGNSGAKYL